MNIKNIHCDVIIPIYNAYDCLEPCIMSVINNTDTKNNSIILIDDKSPDERVVPLLKEFEKKYKCITLLLNEENLGFVGTVNRGMRYSKNDVLLLNSDTEVGYNWLDNIKEVAYSRPMVASVTPLSNNATLVSAPVGLQVNNIPGEMDFNTYTKMVHDIAYNEGIELPTAHGFCMYIRREALDEVGYFDDVTFNKGYGEENDFSFRCFDAGYVHLLCDNTLVYHKESQSFSSKKEEQIKKNSEILNKKYPSCMNQIGNWCSHFPINHICHNIMYNLLLGNKKKNILYIIHSYSEETSNVGGTTLHLLDLKENMLDEYNVHILYPDCGGYRLKSYSDLYKTDLLLNCESSLSRINFYNSDYKKMLDSVVKGLGIDLIHVHHMIGSYFDIADVAKENNIKLYCTCHDYYPICPRINLLYNDKNYCQIDENANCETCLNNTMGLKSNVINNWRNEWSKFLDKCDKIFVPNESMIDILGKNIKLKNKITVLEHGLDIKRAEKEEKQELKNIAFIGVLSNHKGLNEAKELIKKNPQYNFFQIGYSEDESMKKSSKNYKYIGKYNREDLQKIIKENKIDLVCMLSIWPETYSYTITEAVLSGVPILCFDLGAQGNRIKKDNLGWTIDIKSKSEDISKKIRTIFENKKEYNKVLESIYNYKIKTTKEMAKEYKNIYKDKNPGNKFDLDELKSLIKSSFVQKENLDSSLLRSILSSRRWRFVSKIRVPKVVSKVIRRH